MGIHVLSPKILSLLDEQPVFSIIQTYLRLVGQNYSIKGYPADSCRWLDLGRKEILNGLEKKFDASYFHAISNRKQI
jgi:NDP-sugar pyrophosphorylase family protein